MYLVFVLLLILPLGFVIFDIVGAEHGEAETVAGPAAGESLAKPTPRLTAAAAAGVAPVLRPLAEVQRASAAAAAQEAATPQAATPAAEPHRYADTTLSPEMSRIVASLSAAYPATAER